MKTEAEALREMEELVDRLVKGRLKYSPLTAEEMPEALRPLAENVNRLAESLSEAGGFAQEIAQGNLDCAPPSRDNFIAAPLKELHSQLTSFCWSIEQLIGGKMVSKLHYPGKLFEWYNALVDKVSQTFGEITQSQPEWGDSVTSWRYHQILSAINQLSAMIIEVDATGAVLFLNPPAREKFLDLQQLPCGGAESGCLLMDYLCSLQSYIAGVSADKLLLSDEFPIIRELYDTECSCWYKITSDRVTLADGSFGIMHIIDDISDWKLREQQLRLSATIDALTSAYTRKAGFQKLEEMVALRAHQTNCVAFVDIDGLKTINDTYGHGEGDFAIKTIAQILMSCLRDTDWVVRYGGDEFLILFMNCDEKGAKEGIERMYARLKSVNLHINKPYLLGFSAGMAPITPDIENVPDLIALIDGMMYQNKQKNKLKREQEKQALTPSAES